ncbi:hypothetical protein L227DRAFT_567792 [Lentinus tigrinus ALCF2SS1-6]|uniref:Fungal-type protein kinase domain-containing protein n=1 Tax=Lentinus tigrinus ALCF2SS1-6 TaxID=1328759 RepID=A0A5C2RQ30_9APHY|nr:hypothetical protein L227DRAFT_567792 [Lentinus tigrinus ALCF2SS1-6]
MLNTENRIDPLKTVLYDQQDVLVNLPGPRSPDVTSDVTVAMAKDCGDQTKCHEKAMHQPLKSFKDPDGVTMGPNSEQVEKKPWNTISGTPIFMATEILQASLDEMTITQTLEHDLEALCWVIVYVVFLHGLRNTGKGSEEYQSLWNEFRFLFSSVSIQVLRRLRYEAFQPPLSQKDQEDPDSLYRSIRNLQRYAEKVHEDLAGILDVIWVVLREAQPRPIPKMNTTRRPKFRSDINFAAEPVAKSGPELSYETLFKTINLVLSEA